MLPYNKNLKQFSQKLRWDMTDAERRLWSKIRGKQLKGQQFYRQKVVGNYIVNFYCAKSSLAIEIDGGQHYTCEGKEKDKKRDDFLLEVGLKVIRFSDRDVFENIEGVLEIIWKEL
ncbi:MAG: DUF559 domain-containing protein [Candidatus Schekmanbacteria bacterium]|nr:DUF559 domain-containing protein [Candidatus Schekmanbacteria bacterium]